MFIYIRAVLAVYSFVSRICLTGFGIGLKGISPNSINISNGIEKGLKKD